MSLRFDWDRTKAAANFRKHGVSFSEAITVFMDPLAYTIEDVAHSGSERREVIIHSANDRLLLVGFTERSEELIRVFSAREATRKERRDHEESANF